MQAKIHYHFEAKMWIHPSEGGWHFVSLPKNIAKEIRNNLKAQEEAWGRMKASVQIDELLWRTAIWFDTKEDTYLLPIKAEIRKKGHLKVNDSLMIHLWL